MACCGTRSLDELIGSVGDRARGAVFAEQLRRGVSGVAGDGLLETRPELAAVIVEIGGGERVLGDEVR